MAFMRFRFSLFFLASLFLAHSGTVHTAQVPFKKEDFIGSILGVGISSALMSRMCLECVFGRQDARPDIQIQVFQALMDCGYPYAAMVKVKKMNRYLGSQLLSFSWGTVPFNTIWINEEAFDKLSPVEQTFAIYHEAAHVALNHPRKLLLVQALSVSGLGAILGIGTAIVFSEYMKNALPSSLLRIATGATCIAIAATTFLSAGLISSTRSYEKEADLHAARILCLTGKSGIVQEYYNTLKNDLVAGRSAYVDRWHPTLYEQVEYLSTCLVVYS